MTSHSATIILTGLPRSGTTLTVALLNKHPDSVALAEPLPIGTMSSEIDTFINEVEEFALETRHNALSGREVRSITVDGELVGNFVKGHGQTTGLRKVIAKNTGIKIDKNLSENFNLYIKHPAVFTSLLQPLRQKFPVFACIRSPLSVLASWQTVDMPINDGRLPMAERFSSELKKNLDSIPNALSRQLFLMGWFLKQYATLPANQIIRFEDLSIDAESALSHACPNIKLESLTLETQDLTQRYPQVDIARLRAELAAIEPVILHHYPEGLPF